MNLQTTVVVRLHYRILRLSGDLDVNTGPGLRTQIFQLLTNGATPLLVDMSQVAFCDSTGLNLAVAAKRYASSQGCSLAFVGLTERVSKVFRLTGVDQFVPTYPTAEAAARELTTCT